MSANIEAPSRHVPYAGEVMIGAEADERFWADVDTFSDWLYAECIDSEPQKVSGFLPKTAWEMEAVAEKASIPLLVAMTLNARGDVRAVASNHIRNRYYEAMHEYRRRITDAVTAESIEE